MKRPLASLGSAPYPTLPAGNIEEAEPETQTNPPIPGDPPSVSDDDRAVARLRKERAENTTKAAMERTAESRAKKAAKKPKAWQPSPGELGPVEEPERTPRSHLFRTWQTEFKQAFPDSPIARFWGGKEYGQAEALLKRYELEEVATAIRYTIRNWTSLQHRLFKHKGGSPDIGVVLNMHGKLVPEAAMWAKFDEVNREYESYGDKYQSRPKELLDRYLVAKQEVESLGLTG